MLLAAALRRAVQLKGGQTALVCADRAWTWKHLHDRIARMAAGLSSMGVRPGDRIMAVMANGDDAFALFHAAAWMRAVIVPLNTRWTADEMAFAVEDCTPVLLVADEVFEAIATEVAARTATPIVGRAGPSPSLESLVAASAPMASVDGADSDLLAIFYTGGTTGRSKGVMLSHGNVAFNSLSTIGEGLYAEAETYLHTSPAFHIAGAGAMFACVVSACVSVVLPRFEAGEVLAAIARDAITETHLVPTMVQMVLDHPAFAATDLSSLRAISYGASPISEAVLDRAMAALPHVGFIQLYGMTELSPVCTFLPPRDHGPQARAKGRHRSAGRASIGVEMAIIGENDERLPARQVGEIIARGPNVMLGYWNRPRETAEALRGGWMHTGDGGRVDDHGVLYVVDRIKDMIVSGGENVYSAEVESALTKHPDVAQCAVIGVPDERWGERVHAVIMARPGTEPTAQSITDHCRSLIAGYKCPRSVEFRDALPLSAAGKVLKAELRAPFWEGRSRNVA